MFSPAYTPHFGGIGKTGIKSIKLYMKCFMGNCHLTFEEINTLFSRVEAILNNRPICLLSSNDFLSLTPGHFHIGIAFSVQLSTPLTSCNESNLWRYARVEKIRQHFWQRWKREYICELQQRTKWRTNIATLNVGELVLVIEWLTLPQQREPYEDP